MKRPLGAQISHMLKDRGVDVIFGIPGVHNQEMYRGIEEAGITHVLARHEQGAGFMAAGYARATGRPGVAYVITGPGLCNIMTPMGQAYSDSVPMLVISSCLDETAAKKGQLHQMKDQRAAAETVCDWSEEARTAEAAYHFIDRALNEFESQRKRPKHLQVPIASLESVCETALHFADVTGRHGLFTPDLEDVLSLIHEAKRPVIVFGGGTYAAHAEHQTFRFAHKLGAAVFVTYAARGVINPSYPLYYGSTIARASSKQVFESADLVLAIGTELAEVDLWRDYLGQTCPLVRVDIDLTNLTPLRGTDVGIHANALGVMSEIIATIQEPIETEWIQEDAEAFRKQARAETDAERPGIVPIVDALRACLPDGTMIYSDMTQFAYVAKEVWDMDRPGHWHHPYGVGTLGYATPAAIGGAVARKGLPTMAIIGDYGFQYTVQELGTAVELGLPLPIILWDNGKLKEIEDSMTAAQIAPNSVIAHNPDFCKLAEAYGAYAARPSTLVEMAEAVNTAFSADRPTLIHITPDITT
ncbi:MAG: thiamine pyrophosphate-binding protein [Arenibacterium sp.]